MAREGAERRSSVDPPWAPPLGREGGSGGADLCAGEHLWKNSRNSRIGRRAGRETRGTECEHRTNHSTRYIVRSMAVQRMSIFDESRGIRAVRVVVGMGIYGGI